jgi:hypothetical protein
MYESVLFPQYNITLRDRIVDFIINFVRALCCVDDGSVTTGGGNSGTNNHYD